MTEVHRRKTNQTQFIVFVEGVVKIGLRSVEEIGMSGNIQWLKGKSSVH